jgi:hypothetical protein
VAARPTRPVSTTRMVAPLDVGPWMEASLEGKEARTLPDNHRAVPVREGHRSMCAGNRSKPPTSGSALMPP